MAERVVRDPYAILGVARDATPAQVARAHRRLAKRHHPDLDPSGDPAGRMRDINEAWTILSSPARRAAWNLEHPVGHGSATGSHWEGRRNPVAGQAPSPATWAAWRVSATATRTARPTRTAPGEGFTPGRPPRRVAQGPVTFRDSPWAAVAVGVVGVVILWAAIVAGRGGF